MLASTGGFTCRRQSAEAFKTFSPCLSLHVQVNSDPARTGSVVAIAGVSSAPDSLGDPYLCLSVGEELVVAPEQRI